MSFEEKSTWIQLGSVLIALGSYFLVAGRMMAEGVDALPPYTFVFVVATVFLVILLITGHVLAVIAGGADNGDERDRLIDWRSEARSAWILGFGVILALNAMALGAGEVWVAHGLLLSLFLSTVAKYAWQLYFYRRGV